uniref:Histone lysine methyltransferase, SET, putative n=1 Tax=Neospora caninum (strain Liverpool) TaxID=572307 RepID=A0A0F7UEH7_NEOCL|nr:TPA: histone lysine methyltransferase, SET, putative [Neospora caninum Liverpool]
MESASTVELINSYAKEKHNGILRCGVHEFKGRVLYATGDRQAGETLLREPPLHSVRADPTNPLYKELESLCKECSFHLEPIWYWCALNSIILDTHPPVSGLVSITQRQSELLRVLHVPSEITPCKEVKKIIRSFDLEKRTSPEELELLLQIWIHNCFEQFEDPVGYVIYFMPSFSSHSCLPNALWFTDEDHTFVLRTRADIAAGDEVTLTYLSEEDLMRPTLHRRRVLSETKDFICACERCAAPVDFSRGFRCPSCGVGTVYVEPDAELSVEEVDEVFAAAGSQTVEAFLPSRRPGNSSSMPNPSTSSGVSSLSVSEAPTGRQPSEGGTPGFPSAHPSQDVLLDDGPARDGADGDSSRPTPLSVSLLTSSASALEGLLPLTIWMCLLFPALAAARLAGGRRTSWGSNAEACIIAVGPQLSSELSGELETKRVDASGLLASVSPAQMSQAVLARIHRSLASIPTVKCTQQQVSPNACVLCKREWTHRDRVKCLALEALMGRWANPQDDADSRESVEGQDEDHKQEEDLDVDRAEEEATDGNGFARGKIFGQGGSASQERGPKESSGGGAGGSAAKQERESKDALAATPCSERTGQKKRRDKEREDGGTRREGPSVNGRTGEGLVEEEEQDRNAQEAHLTGAEAGKASSTKTSRRKSKKKFGFDVDLDETDNAVQSQRRGWLMGRRVSFLRRLLKKSWRRALPDEHRHCLDILLPEIFQVHWHLVCWLKTRAATSTGAERAALQDAVVYQQRNLYPGLNAALGWSLDEMAEMLLMAYRDQPDKPVKLSSTSMKALLQDRSILAAYEEAVSILGTLFETNHQFVTDVTKKLGVLSDWIHRCGLEMEPLATPWLTAGQRFFQRSYSGHTTPGLLCLSDRVTPWAIVERSFQLPQP